METLSDKIQAYGIEDVKPMYHAEDVKQFIKQIQFWANIDLGKQTLTIDYDKFKELAGDKLI